MHTLFLIITVFLTSAVEVVEMVTIVVGVGATRGWSATLVGSGVGILVLAAIVGGLGTALTFVPINVLRAVVGALLLLFGLQWLRQSVYRISRLGWSRQVHEEEEVAAAEPGRRGFDWTAFTLSFKGVVLEGLEVAFIVVTFGAATHQLTLGIAGAAAAFVLVGLGGVFVRRYVQAIPRRLLKFAVGILLTAYGTFWGAEGLGVSWPLSDFAILVLLAFYGLVSFAAYGLLRRGRPSVAEAAP